MNKGVETAKPKRECWRTLDSNGKDIPYKAQVSSWGNIRVWMDDDWKYVTFKENAAGKLSVVNNFVLQSYAQGRPLELLMWHSFKKSRPTEVWIKSTKIDNPLSIENLCLPETRGAKAVNETAIRKFLKSKYYYHSVKFKKVGEKK